jgi:PAS domain S-box-containing protein
LTTAAPKHVQEADRLAALRSFEVLDTEPEAVFDGITALAARICDAPIAVVNLIDGDRQWFKSEVGLGVRETPLETSFCAHALLQQDELVVPDATADPRFTGNPLVTGDAHLRFYAGVLLKTGEGLPIGTLCVLDTRPRDEGLSPLQLDALRTLARQTMSLLEMRRSLIQRERGEEAALKALEAADLIGSWDWDIASDTLFADGRFAAMYGVDPELGRRGGRLDAFTAGIHPDDAERVAAEIERAVAGRGAFESEYRVTADGRTRWLLARGQVFADASGAAVRFPGVAIDITRRKTAELELAQTLEALTESEAKFRVLADAMPQMVWSTLPDGFHDYYNARWYEFTGVPLGSTDGEGWNDMFHPEDRERAWAAWRRALETGEPYEIEYRLRHSSGVYRWTLGRATALRGEDGEIVRWFGTCTDIDELKRMEQGKELLSQELSHRIKNIFAVVSALVALSARQFPEAKAFASVLRTRVNALARAHEFVRPHTEASRPTVGTRTLHAFLADLFRAYATPDGAPRVRISGDDALFDDQAATSVALLFHELATNAAKYGALSTDRGHVDLTTRREDERFVLVWTEAGGPAVTGAPAHQGFGSSLATLSVEGQLGGRLQREWRSEGLRITADLPATALSRRRAAEKSSIPHPA